MSNSNYDLLREFLAWSISSYGGYELGSKTAGKIDRPSLKASNTFPYVIKNPDLDDDIEEEDDIIDDIGDKIH
jgi:hypothetical protein